MPEFRYIGWPEYGRLTEKLADKVRSGGMTYDLVIGIARGGIPVAMVVSDRLGTKVDFINVKSYSGIARRGVPRILTALAQSVKGQKVLLVDDLVDHGTTLAVVKKHLDDMNPALLQTAVILRKPWSKTEPDYYVEDEEKWVVFPFELGEVERLRAEASRER